MSDRALDDFIERYSMDRILLQRERRERQAAVLPTTREPEITPEKHSQPSDRVPPPERKP